MLIVGGGPAGSACASRLAAAGVDVMVVDRARFPRDKPCAGWITTEAVAAMELDLAAYAVQNALQPITRFRVGVIGGRATEVDYRTVVSYAIRRSQLDDHLLRRSGARLRLGEPVSHFRRQGGLWVVDDRLEAKVLIGAGGHFCPVARAIGGQVGKAALVVARQVELRLTPDQVARCAVEDDRPELDFSRDLAGYGWCVRKGEWLNLGLGRRDVQDLNRHVHAFLAALVAAGRIPPDLPTAWPGHAYLLREGPARRVVDDGVLLVGDAAGLAHPASGEGILPAVRSGRLAARVLLEAAGDYRRERLLPYAERLPARVGPRSRKGGVPGPLRALAGRAALHTPWLARHLVLDRWFLHRA